MRIVHGVGLLLVSTMLVGVSGVPADAATGCDAPDTTWLGPSDGGSAAWAEPTNWTNGVPTAESVVCIPATPTGPEVASDATAATLTLQGGLTVDTTLEVGALEADGGTLSGGSTTVTSSLTGTGLTLSEGAALDQWGTAVLGDWSAQGSRLTVHGDAVLAPGAEIDTLGGLFTIADTGSLTMDVAGSSAEVIGGFANHGAVTGTAGSLFMMGAGTDAGPDEFSTGTFIGSDGAEFSVAHTELRTGARLDHLAWVDHMTVPLGNTATISDSTIYWDPAEPEPNLAGAGELVLTDAAIVGGRIAGGLKVTVPSGEVVKMGDAVVQDQVQVRVDGELQGSEIQLNEDAVLDIHGVHRAAGGYGAVDFSGDDPGIEIIHPTGQLLSDADSGIVMSAPFVSHGTVDSGSGFIYLGPRSASPSPSSGTFRADPAGTLLLGSNVVGDPPFALDGADIEGVVHVSGEVAAEDLDVRGELSTDGDGQLALNGTTTMADGASIAGNVTVPGQLQADLGPTGTASLSGAEVTGSVLAISGTLSVPTLGPNTLGDGTLTQGRWDAWPGATLDLPAITTNDTLLMLDGPGASFGDGLANLTAIGPNGTLLPVGVDLAVPGPFRNEGMLALGPRARLDVGGKFEQLATGTLYTYLDSTGRGRVRAAGPRDLAGTMWVERDPAYKPPVGTVLNVITSAGATTADDAFDKVKYQLRRYGTTRKLQVTYDVNHVRVRVDRVS